MSYEFMDMINRHLESQMESRELEKIEMENQKALKIRNCILTILGSIAVLLTFLLETPH